MAEGSQATAALRDFARLANFSAARTRLLDLASFAGLGRRRHEKLNAHLVAKLPNNIATIGWVAKPRQQQIEMVGRFVDIFHK
jgi:hypothetical protein